MVERSDPGQRGPAGLPGDMAQTVQRRDHPTSGEAAVAVARRRPRLRRCEAGGMRWLVVSLGLSIVLTVLVNVLFRLFPDTGRRAARGLESARWRPADDTRPDDRRVR